MRRWTSCNDTNCIATIKRRNLLFGLFCFLNECLYLGQGQYCSLGAAYRTACNILRFVGYLHKLKKNLNYRFLGA